MIYFEIQSFFTHNKYEISYVCFHCIYQQINIYILCMCYFYKEMLYIYNVIYIYIYIYIYNLEIEFTINNKLVMEIAIL
jgi:hypothetical protein